MAKSSDSPAKTPRKKTTRKKAAKKAAAPKASAAPTTSAPTGEPVITATTPPKPRRTRSKTAEPAKVAAAQQTAAPTHATPGDGQAGAAIPAASLSHDEIATRAFDIWVRKGRPYGQDDQNWREAELELLAERQPSAI